MFFHATGVKDGSDKNYTLDLLIDAKDPEEVRVFLSHQKVVILGIEEYGQDPRSFGDIYADIQGVGGSFRIVVNLESIKDVVDYIISLNIQVLDVNSYSSPLSPEAVQNLINQSVNEHDEAQRIAEEKAAEEEKKSQLSYHDKKLQKAYEAIEMVTNQFDQLFDIGKSVIPPLLQKKMDDERGEISKLHLATNYDKILDELHKAMNLVIEAQDVVLDSLESDKIFSILPPNGQVTNIEVIRDQMQLSKSRLLTELGANLSQKESIDASLGYTKFFYQYLKKDFLFLSQNRYLFVKEVFNSVEILLLFTIIELAIFFVFSDYFGVEFGLKNLGIMLVFLSVPALLFRGVNEYIQLKSIGSYIMWFILIVIISLLVFFGIKRFLVF